MKRERIVLVDREDTMYGCWIMEAEYASWYGKNIHQVYASGNGELVRHLCSNKHCINPMHLLRGSTFENYRDEVERQGWIVAIANSILIEANWPMIQNDLFGAVYQFARYKKAMEGNDSIWDEDTAKGYLEMRWKKLLKQKIKDKTLVTLDERTRNEQESNATILMSKLRYNRKITIVEI